MEKKREKTRWFAAINPTHEKKEKKNKISIYSGISQEWPIVKNIHWSIKPEIIFCIVHVDLKYHKHSLTRKRFLRITIIVVSVYFVIFHAQTTYVAESEHNRVLIILLSIRLSWWFLQYFSKRYLLSLRFLLIWSFKQAVRSVIE